MVQRSAPIQFGHYLLVEKLGAGSTAEVYRARRAGEDPGVPGVALRRLRPEWAADESRRAKLLREAETARGLIHPLFCRVYELGEADGLPYLTMELVPGQPLARLLRWLRLRGQGAPMGAALHVVAELCAGLHYAYAAPFGFVHGDVSPHNVIVQPDGQVKLVDVGGRDSTDPDEVEGTLGYLAPELLTGSQPSHASDLYACSVLFWELLAHRRLFPARAPAEALKLRRVQPLPSPGEGGKSVEDTLQRALLPNPGRRFQSGRELRTALLDGGRRAGVEPSAAELGRLMTLVFGLGEPLD